MDRSRRNIQINPAPWNTQNTHLILWHGTVGASADQISHNNVDLDHSRPGLDFGRGFYTTTERLRAEIWAKIVFSWLSDEERAVDRPVVIKFRIPLQQLVALDSLMFVRVDFQYWSFVTHCRRATARTLRGHIHPIRPGPVNWYDVVCGPIVRKWPPNGQEIYPNSDQFSFHTPSGIAILNQVIANGDPDFQIVTL